MRHLVTGGSSGIGACLVGCLRARGDEVIAPTRAEIDLSASGAVEAWAQSQAISHLDSLVHCAGVVNLAAIRDFDRIAWEDTLAVNLLAPAALTSAMLPALRVAGGTVVFVNSGAGLSANPQWGSYAASKFGLRALADSLRAEEPGIRVTSVFPGRTSTRMQAEVHRQEGRPYEPSDWIRPETVAEAIIGVVDQGADAQTPEIVLRPR